MALSEYGLGTTWEDEEERRRKEKEKREKQRLGIAGAPIKLKGQPARTATPTQPRHPVTQPTKFVGRPGDRDAPRVDDQRSSYFTETSREATTKVATKDKESLGVLSEYFTLKNKVGEENLVKRFNSVASLAVKYMDSYDTSGLVWDLVRSPYNESQIEYMIRSGSKALYDPTFRLKGTPPVSQGLLKAMGIDPNDQMMGDEVSAKMQEAGGMGASWGGTGTSWGPGGGPGCLESRYPEETL